jgi:D-lyxose ketol-isomerase
MKRSEINSIMRDSNAFIQQHCFFLPPFAYWKPEEWSHKGEEVAEIVNRQLGWDITDFGSGDFEHIGLFVFTIRNGDPENLKLGMGKLYAEKILIVNVNQVTPMHFHWKKVEDIINRGGGNLKIQVYNSTANDQLDDTDVNVSVDGIKRVVPAGEVITLSPGESITITEHLYHKFWGAENRVLVGEVSTVNDDRTDNRFLEPVGRFPEIEEDSPPMHLLCTDYPTYYNLSR